MQTNVHKIVLSQEFCSREAPIVTSLSDNGIPDTISVYKFQNVASHFRKTAQIEIHLSDLGFFSDTNFENWIASCVMYLTANSYGSSSPALLLICFHPKSHWKSFKIHHYSRWIWTAPYWGQCINLQAVPSQHCMVSKTVSAWTLVREKEMRWSCISRKKLESVLERLCIAYQIIFSRFVAGCQLSWSIFALFQDTRTQKRIQCYSSALFWYGLIDAIKAKKDKEGVVVNRWVQNAGCVGLKIPFRIENLVTSVECFFCWKDMSLSQENNTWHWSW